MRGNPNCQCLIAHTRRLGVVCPTSSVPVDVFAEDFWDRFCEPELDPCSTQPGKAALSRAPFQVYVHPKPPTTLALAGVAAPAEAARLSRLVSGAGGCSPGETEGPPSFIELESPPSQEDGANRFSQTPWEAVESMRLSEVWELRLSRGWRRASPNCQSSERENC